MNKIVYFNYKHRKYSLYKGTLPKDLPGIIVFKHGVNNIILNKNLNQYKKNIEFHRLVTGRGLNLFKDGKNVGKFYFKR